MKNYILKGGKVREVYVLQNEELKKITLRTPQSPFKAKTVIAAIGLLLSLNIYQFSNSVMKAHASKIALHCEDFNSQVEAQAAHDAKLKGYSSLYANKDGKVCTKYNY